MDSEDLTILHDWVRQESPTASPQGVNAMGSLVQQAARANLFTAKSITTSPNFGNMLILRGGPQNGKAPALLIGHLDTVHPLGTIQGRFPVRVENQRFHGPGVYDMKAGVLMGLRAAELALAQGGFVRPIVFILAPDEEMGSPSSRPVTESLARNAAYCLVLEPAREDGSCVTCRKGVGRFEISVRGLAAHAGVRHDAGRSAIAEAAHQILNIEAMTDYGRGITATVGTISGGTSPNTVPQNCSFSVDFRAPTLETCRDAENTVRSLHSVTPGTTLIKEGGIIRPPYERTEGNIRLFREAQMIAADLNLSLEESPQTGGGSDGNFTAALGIPTLDALGADGGGAHTLQEYVLLSTFEQRKQLIAGLLRKLQ